MNETPKCPYCGAEMEEKSVFDSKAGSGYVYACPVCYSSSPMVPFAKGIESIKAKALELALHRAEGRDDA